MSSANANMILWIGVSFALTAIMLVLTAICIKHVRFTNAKQLEAKRNAIMARLFDAALSDDANMIKLRWTDSPVLLAEVLCKALENVRGDVCLKLVQVAALSGCEIGLCKMARARSTQSRITAVRTLRYFPAARPLLETMAKSDRKIAVRVNALTSLAHLGCAPSTKIWSSWIGFGALFPAPYLRTLLNENSLISPVGLTHAVKNDLAPTKVKVWALEALAKQDPLQAEALASQIAIDPLQSLSLQASAISLLKDPESLIRCFDDLLLRDSWLLKVTACETASRLRVFQIRPRLAHLIFDPDWRVRSAASVALTNLKGQLPVAQIICLGKTIHALQILSEAA